MTKSHFTMNGVVIKACGEDPDAASSKVMHELDAPYPMKIQSVRTILDMFRV